MINYNSSSYGSNISWYEEVINLTYNIFWIQCMYSYCRFAKTKTGYNQSSLQIINKRQGLLTCLFLYFRYNASMKRLTIFLILACIIVAIWEYLEIDHTVIAIVLWSVWFIFLLNEYAQKKD